MKKKKGKLKIEIKSGLQLPPRQKIERIKPKGSAYFK